MYVAGDQKICDWSGSVSGCLLSSARQRLAGKGWYYGTRLLASWCTGLDLTDSKNDLVQRYRAFRLQSQLQLAKLDHVALSCADMLWSWKSRANLHRQLKPDLRVSHSRFEFAFHRRRAYIPISPKRAKAPAAISNGRWTGNQSSTCSPTVRRAGRQHTYGPRLAFPIPRTGPRSTRAEMGFRRSEGDEQVRGERGSDES